MYVSYIVDSDELQTIRLPANEIEGSYTIAILTGVEYNISVFGENILGNGSAASICE